VAGADGGGAAALTAGCQSAFAVAIVIAVLGTVAAAVLLGTRRTPDPVAEPTPA
jgi:hypothetical protein